MDKKEYFDLKEGFKTISSKIDAVEEYMRMLLLSNIESQLSDSVNVIEEKNLVLWLEKHNLKYIKREHLGEEELCFFSYKYKSGLKEIRKVMKEFKENFDIIPVGVFEKITARQRGLLIEEGYSYWIPEKELYIYSRI